MTIRDGDRGSRSYMGVGNDGRGMTLDAYRKLIETLREAGYATAKYEVPTRRVAVLFCGTVSICASLALWRWRNSKPQ